MGAGLRLPPALCRGRRAYELANHAVSARSRARGSSSTSRRGRSCAPHRASVECRAPQTFRHRVEWCGGAEPVESEHRAETRVYNTCFQTQLKTRERTERKALVLWPTLALRPAGRTVKCTHMRLATWIPVEPRHRRRSGINPQTSRLARSLTFNRASTRSDALKTRTDRRHPLQRRSPQRQVSTRAT